MYPRLKLIILILVTACVTGCDNQSHGPTDVPVTQPEISIPKPMLTPIDGTPALTEGSLQAVEQKYSCKLPDDYRRFLLKNNGVFPSPDYVSFEEAGRKTVSDVFCFFAIGDERPWASIEWHYKTYSGRLPNNTFPIARDSCGNLWLLSVRSDSTGSVFFWDHGSYDTFDETDLDNWPLVAASFQEFRDKLGTFDKSTADNIVPSRYSLVKQATESMAKNNSGFSTRANPGFVWHCVCDDDDKVTMEFVKYEVHAAVTHTCGYSRLRALKGLIKEGQTRLP